MCVWVCGSQISPGLCSTGAYSWWRLCVWHDAQLQDTQSETMFLHYAANCQCAWYDLCNKLLGAVPPASLQHLGRLCLGALVRVSLLSQDSHQICSPGAHTASKGPVTAQINLRLCKIFGFEPWWCTDYTHRASWWTVAAAELTANILAGWASTTQSQ